MQNTRVEDLIQELRKLDSKEVITWKRTFSREYPPFKPDPVPQQPGAIGDPFMPQQGMTIG